MKVFFTSLPELAGSGCHDAIMFDLVLLISIHCSWIWCIPRSY